MFKSYKILEVEFKLLTGSNPTDIEQIDFNPKKEEYIDSL